MGDAGSDVSETSRTPIWRSMRPNGAAAAVIDFFDPCMKDAVEARRGLESALRAALALGEFSLVYQPQFDLATATVTGFEALLRWTRSDGTAVTPASFITWAGAIGRMPHDRRMGAANGDARCSILERNAVRSRSISRPCSSKMQSLPKRSCRPSLRPASRRRGSIWRSPKARSSTTAAISVNDRFWAQAKLASTTDMGAHCGHRHGL